MFKAIFLFNDGTRCVGHFEENLDMLNSEEILDAFESAKEKKTSFYLGALPFTKIYYKGKILDSVDYWMSAEDVENVRLWKVGEDV